MDTGFVNNMSVTASIVSIVGTIITTVCSVVGLVILIVTTLKKKLHSGDLSNDLQSPAHNLHFAMASN